MPVVGIATTGPEQFTPGLVAAELAAEEDLRKLRTDFPYWTFERDRQEWCARRDKENGSIVTLIRKPSPVTLRQAIWRIDPVPAAMHNLDQ